MISNIWRERLIYTAMSVFVAFQSLVIVVTPAPSSELADWLRSLVQPYPTLFRLDNQWDFFAPNVGEGTMLRYEIEITDSERRNFMAADELSWFHPNYYWFRSWFYRIMDHPDVYGRTAAAYFCQKHADLKPTAITFFEILEEPYSSEDYLSGYDRMSSDFLTVTPLQRYECRAE